MEENKNDSLKKPIVSTGFTIKGLRVLLAFSFVATVLAFAVAFVEHRQYTELVERYDDAIVKISEYQSSVAELSGNAGVTEAGTRKEEVATTAEVTKTEESKSETYTEKTTTAKAQEVTTAKAEKSSTYYVTQSGKKYHMASCSYLSKSKIAITMDRIKAEGYTPCSRCIK